MNILVIDVGTSSMRGLLLSHTGELLTQEQRLYAPSYLENGYVEQNPEDWQKALLDILKNISEKAGESKIEAISITSQRSSVIAMDRDMKPIGNAIMWQDKRTDDICKRLSGENDKVFSLSGSRINPVFSGTKMTWIRENLPEVYSRTHKFMVIPDYLIYLLTGNIVTDYTYGSRSLLMNLKNYNWNKELLDIFSVEEDKLCKLIEPGSICGHITKAISQETGCPEGIPVITAGGDQQCGAIGQGVVRKGVLSITAGTGAFLITSVEELPENPKQDIICNCSSVKGEYMLETNVLTCCSAFDWFRREFYGGASSKELDRDVMNSPIGANGCICVPYFQGRSAPDWNSFAKGTFTNITLGNTRADMLRSLLEGICYEIADHIDTMKKYSDISRIYVNGGLTNSAPFNEIQSSVYGERIMRRGKSDATARGALMVAATSLCEYETVAEAFKKIDENAMTTEYHPKDEDVKMYKGIRKEMNLIYKKISSSHDCT